MFRFLLRLRGLGLLLALVVGGAGLLLEGEFEGAAIAFLLLALIIGALARPFASLPPGKRIIARLLSTGAVVAAWMVGGALLWDWEAADYGVAAMVGVIALQRAGSGPRG